MVEVLEEVRETVPAAPSAAFDVKGALGRDAEIRAPGASGAPLPFDSVVIRGTGVSALAFAGRMARDPRLQGKVAVVGKAPPEIRKLINGVTFRARTLDYLSVSFGESREALLKRLYGSDWRGAETDEQRGSLVQQKGDGYRIVNPATWMDGAGTRAGRTEGAPLAYGLRNSRLVNAMLDAAKDVGVIHHDQDDDSHAALQEAAPGERPLIVNGTPKPVEGADMVDPGAKPDRFVAAAQVAFRDPHRDKKGVLGPHSAFVGLKRREGLMDMGVYYPFRDALSPAARFYGIYYRVCPATADKEHEQKALEHAVIGVGEALGFEPDDPAETLALAWVPCSPWKGVRDRQKGIFDVSRIAGAGAPIITGDGMTRAAVGSLAAAEALLSGADPAAATDRALVLYKRYNRLMHDAMTRAPRMASLALRLAPGLALKPQGHTRDLDMWAGAW